MNEKEQYVFEEKFKKKPEDIESFENKIDKKKIIIVGILIIILISSGVIFFLKKEVFLKDMCKELSIKEFCFINWII